MTIKLLVPALVVATTLLGCASTSQVYQTYPGAAKAASEQAIIKMATINTRVFKVDGEMTAGLATAMFGGYPQTLAVLPGVRSVWVGYHKDAAYSVRSHFCLPAEAGATYLVKADVTYVSPTLDNVRFTILDERTQRPAALNVERCN